MLKKILAGSFALLASFSANSITLGGVEFDNWDISKGTDILPMEYLVIKKINNRLWLGTYNVFTQRINLFLAGEASSVFHLLSGTKNQTIPLINTDVLVGESAVFKYQVDCQKQRYRILRVRTYKKSMAEGTISHDEGEKATWLLPDTYAEDKDNMSIACTLLKIKQDPSNVEKDLSDLLEKLHHKAKQ